MAKSYSSFQRFFTFLLAGSLFFLLSGVLLPSGADASAPSAKPESDSNFFDGVDEALEKWGSPIPLSNERDWSLKVGGALRHRIEIRDDFNLNDRTYEDEAINLIRSRLELDLSLKPNLRFFAQGQSSLSFAGREASKSSAFVNELDIHQFYADVTSPVKEIPLKVRAGRQMLAYGDQRFVGGFEWSNVARVFDAVKLMWTPVSWFQLDAWWSQVVRINPGQADSANHDDNFFGFYAVTKPFEDHVFDTFFFIRRSRDRTFAGELPQNAGPLKEYTYGNRFVGEKWGFDYGLEYAIQRGKRASEKIEAWAWHSRAGYTLRDLPWTPRVGVEYNYGSGDSNPRDGKFGTFDNLFPTNHLHYGYIDFASLRNIHHFQLGLKAKPRKDVVLRLDYHWFFLDTAADAFYNAGGAVIRPATTGASTTVGQEIDLFAKWTATRHLSFLTGYSHFHSGAFIRDAGAGNDNANFFYFQTEISF